ncbi:hypothetical protein [uncultured Pelagimonas sp.]|uniref:hypothetical protein n=1 Tax=uncultured Pelagimonas sp. TaxID=1618102 RepID=UPI0026196B08|nr:hypothetical protein [uncultured Pelagimonas sp.]
MRRFQTSFSALLMITTCLSGFASAQTAPEITQIELGQAGIARYTMSAEANGNLISFTVPEAASSDVLASLVVRDPAGGVVDLQTDTPGSAAAALRETAFARGIPHDTEQLLFALKGETVSLSSATSKITGQVMGLRHFTAVEGGELVDRAAVILLSGTGVSEFILTPGVNVGFSEKIAARLAKALDAGQVSQATRQFDLTLEADSQRAINLSYVTEAAAWKNSWRLLLDEGRLQGWATFENVSGADWDKVDLTLTTGSPVAFQRDLIDPHFVSRSKDDTAKPEAIRVKASPAGMGLLSMNSARSASPSAPRPAPASGSASAGDALDSSGILRYALPDAVDLKDGRTANLMYLDLAIEPKIRGLYRPAERRGTILMAASITSDQALASGLVSVQDQNGFVGDAPFLGMQAGQSTLLPFAAVTGSDIRTLEDRGIRLTTVVYQDGRLTLDFEDTRTTTYSGTLPEMADVFTVEHPVGFGKLDSTNGSSEQINGVYRITAPVKDSVGEISIVERKTYQKRVRIGASDFATVLADIESGQVDLSAAHKAAFEQASDLKVKFEEVREAHSAANTRYKELGEEQKRLLENLETVKQDALRNRYLEALDKAETEIAKSFDDRDRLKAELRGFETSLRAIFANM